MVLEQCIGFYNTAPIWLNKQFGIQQFEFPSVDLSTLTTQKIPTNRRLGHQMEFVFQRLISNSELYSIILHNLPVKDDKRTVGEIDFILKNIESERLIHIELTYKFYIIDNSISEPIHRLMGPNRRDMFFTKMQKIKNHQFELLHSPAGKKALQSKNVNSEELEHQCCFKAQLFVPYQITDIHIRPLNKDCVTGFWIRFDDFNSSEFKQHEYYIPTKSEWVVSPSDNVTYSSHFEILMDINLRMLNKNAPMLWMKKDDGAYEKLFVVWW